MSLYRALRGYATRWPRPKPGTAERPPYRAPDPLINNPTAIAAALPDDNLTFIHRPPPTAPAPQSFITDPSSPLLRPKRSDAETSLPPLVNPSAAEKTAPERVSAEDIAKIKQLRREDPKKYTRGTLAKMFGTTQGFIGLVAALPKPRRTAIRKQQELEHQAMRDAWGQRKTVARAIRAKRRELW